MEKDIIRVRNLTARYGETVILEDVSFDVRDKEVFVILGGSGCGKSTLLKHMIGLDIPHAGNVEIDGTDITRCTDEAFHDVLVKIGVLFQNSALIGSMTLGENVALPIFEYTALSRQLVERMVRMKLRMVDLDGYENHYPSELSGGMKKRAGLARAMALNPKILFLDEPTAGLDPVAARVLKARVQRARGQGRTVLLTSHDLGQLRALADDVIFLVEGTVRFQGPVERLLAETGEEELEGALARLMTGGAEAASSGGATPAPGDPESPSGGGPTLLREEVA